MCLIEQPIRCKVVPISIDLYQNVSIKSKLLGWWSELSDDMNIGRLKSHENGIFLKDKKV
jgi:hypothetical protein